MTRLSSPANYLRHVLVEFAYLVRARRIHRTLLPSPADKPPSGANWIHEIKHDGYRPIGPVEQFYTDVRHELAQVPPITGSGNEAGAGG